MIKKLWYVLYPLLIYLVVSFAVSTVMTFGIATIYTAEMMAQGEVISEALLMEKMYSHLMLINLVSQIILIPILILLYYFDFKNKRVIPDSIFERVSVVKYLLILPIAIGLCCGLNRLIGLIPMELAEDWGALAENIFSSELWIQILSVVVCAAVLEELLFRGLIYKRLMSVGMQKKGAFVLSAGIFGLIHGNLVQFLYAFALGLVLVYVYDKYKSIAAPILLHMAANAFSVYMSSEAGQVLEPFWKIGPAYFIAMAMELAVSALLLKVVSNEVNPERKITSSDIDTEKEGDIAE